MQPPLHATSAAAAARYPRVSARQATAQMQWRACTQEAAESARQLSAQQRAEARAQPQRERVQRRQPGPQTDVNTASSTAARSADRTGAPGQTDTALPSRTRAPAIQVTNSLRAEIAGAADDTPTGPTEDDEIRLIAANGRARCDMQHGSGPAESSRQEALLLQRNCAALLSVENLQLQNIPIMWQYLCNPTFSRFYTIPECDRHTHTDGRTDTRRRHVLRLP